MNLHIVDLCALIKSSRHTVIEFPRPRPFEVAFIFIPPAPDSMATRSYAHETTIILYAISSSMKLTFEQLFTSDIIQICRHFHNTCYSSPLLPHEMSPTLQSVPPPSESQIILFLSILLLPSPKKLYSHSTIYTADRDTSCTLRGLPSLGLQEGFSIPNRKAQLRVAVRGSGIRNIGMIIRPVKRDVKHASSIGL